VHGEQTVQLPPVSSAKFLKFFVYKWTLEGFKVEKVVYVARILGKGVNGEFMWTCTWTILDIYPEKGDRRVVCKEDIAYI